nr:condensation domain-containing protein [Enterocloster clostridioformis]
MNHVENMKTILEIFKNKGIALFVDGQKLKYRASHGIYNDDILLLKEHKEALIQYLKEHVEEIRIISAPEDMYKPFALTDVQAAWKRLVARHEMLRAIVNENGTQQVLPEVNEFTIQEYDFLHTPDGEQTLEGIRTRMGNAMYELGSWPMFEIAVSHTEKESILHFSMEFLIADWKSIWMLLYEFETLYFKPEQLLPEVEVTFRDYLIAERKLRETEQYKVDKEYWLNRIESLPKSPELPMLRNPIRNRSDFSRHFMEIDQEKWNKLKRFSNHYGITPTAAVLTAYAEVIERWSQTPEFCINLTILNRAPIHQKVEEIVGDFTSVSLLETRMEKSKPFLDHRLFNGVEVIREISRKKGREHALMPIVFTSAIGLSDKTLQGEFHGNGISQTAQVFIDCQVMDGEYGLQADWDVRNGVFPDGMIKDMFETFRDRLLELAETDMNWIKASELELPEWQMKQIAGTNSTEREISPQMLYDEFLKQVKMRPSKTAVIDSEAKVTYLELHYMALGIAGRLRY